MDGMIQQAVEQNVLRAVQQVEDQIDAELHRLENLDEDELEKLRQGRINEMKRMQKKKAEWAAKGHGEYTDIEEKQFFKQIKGEERCICHFYRDSFPCKIIDKHLAILAKQHLETKFIRVHAEKAPFLTERLKIWMLPTLAIIKHEKTTDYIVGLDDMGGVEDFSTEVLRGRLALLGAIFDDAIGASGLGGGGGKACSGGKEEEEEVHQRTIRQGGFKKTESDEDSDFE